MKKNLLTACVIYTAFILQAKTTGAVENATFKNRAPLAFIENKGQVTDQNKQTRTDIQFSLKAAPGLNIFIGPGTIHYQFGNTGKKPAAAAKRLNGKTHAPAPSIYSLHRMDVELQGSNPDAEVITDEKQNYFENYVNAESGKELTANTYNRITYKNIYPNIDWVLYFKEGHLEHEFLIHEGGNPNNIRLKYGGSSSLKINSDGSLSAVTPLGSITEQAPLSYQTNGTRINSHYVLNGNVISYKTDSYKGNLVIDPGLDWATYYGGANADYGFNVATDTSGNVYMSGYTLSLGLATAGAYDTLGDATYTSAFLAKFSAGGALLWSTYYGAYPGAYQSRCVTTDAANNVYIGCYSNNYGTVVKFNAGGTYQWAQSFGELNANSTFVFGLATDKNSNVYVTGATKTADDIALGNTHQTSLDGQSNAYLIKYNSSGLKQWGTYYGGTGDEAGYGIAVDASGYIYISGSSTSSTGVATPGAYLATNNGSFLAKFDTTGNLVWGTYYYGQACWSVAIDKTSGVYVCGTINNSTPGLSTPGAYQTAYGGGTADGFLARFTTSGTLSWATYFGGSDEDYGQGITTDNRGNVYLTGLTYSDSGIATPDAYRTAIYGGGRYDDAYLAQFNTAGTLLYATYFGGDGSDWGYSIAADGSSNIYMTGNTFSQYGLATPGAYDVLFNAGNGSGIDAFLAKFQFCVGGNSGNITGPATVCAGDTIILTDTVSGGLWSISDTSVATINSAGKVTGLAPGNVSVYYTFTNICNVAAYNLQVNAPPGGSINAEGASTFCQGDSLILNAGSGADLTYQWLLNGEVLAGDTDDTISAREGGTYSVKISSTASCGSTTLPGVAVTVNKAPAAIVVPQGPTTFCQGDSVPLSSNSAKNYLWSNGATTQNINIKQAGNYTVKITDNNNCPAQSQVTTVVVNPLPTVNAVSNQTLCTGAATSLVNFTGNTPGVSYLWTNDNTNTGLAANGSGSIASFTAQNNGSAPITSTITVTPLFTGYAYITNETGSNTVDVIDRSTNTVIATITVGNNPQGVSVSPDGTKVYVLNWSSNSISVISTATNTVIDSIQAGYAPEGIVFSPNGGKLYVSNIFDNTVLVVNTNTNTITDTFHVGAHPQGMAISADGNTLYVGSEYDDSLCVINTVTKVRTGIHTGNNPSNVAISPDGSKLYVALQSLNMVIVMNRTTLAVLDTIPQIITPVRMALSPDGSKLYAAGGGEKVSVIYTATDSVVNILIGATAFGLGVSPDGGTLFVALSDLNAVYTYNTATNAPVSQITRGLTAPYCDYGNFITGTGCSGTPITFTITVNPDPTPGFTGSAKACGSVTLTGTGGSSYLWSGGSNPNMATDTFANGGTYNLTVTNSYGCSASASQAVSVYSLPNAIITSEGNLTFCQGDSVILTSISGTKYFWSTGAVSQSIAAKKSGSYTVNVTNVNNCSATSAATIVTVDSLPVATISAEGLTSFCPGDSVILKASTASSYLWSNNATIQIITVKSSGNFSVIVTNSNNCSASSGITTTTVHPAVTSNIDKSICAGQSYLGYNTPGLHIDTFYNVSMYGCDSIRSLNLNIQSIITTTINQGLCYGTSYSGYTKAGTYIDTFSAGGGCDSVRTLVLTLLPPGTSTIAQAICAGESYVGYTLPGTHIDTFYNASVNGCDSIRTLNLSLIPASVSNISYAICAGQSYEGYTTAGVYMDTLQNASANGCDSIRTLNLSVLPPAEGTITTNICAGQNYLGHDSTGLYVDTLYNASVNGCDSIRTLNLVVQSTINTTISDSVCNGGNYYGHSSTGVYVDSFSAAGGCDSIRTLNLTVRAALQSSLSDSVCEGTALVFNGTTLTMAGDYYDTLQSQFGCDSMVTLHLYIDSLPVPLISRTNDTLSVQQFESYQWLLNDSTIDLANAQTLAISQNGNYSVAVINANGCGDTSAVLNITGLGIDEFAAAYSVKVYPNPNNGNFAFEFSDNKIREVEITDGIGRVVVPVVRAEKRKNFNLEGLSPGIYFLYVIEHGERRGLKFSVAK